MKVQKKIFCFYPKGAGLLFTKGNLFARETSLVVEYGKEWDEDGYIRVPSYKNLNISRYLGSAVYTGICIQDDPQSTNNVNYFEGTAEALSQQFNAPLLMNRALNSIGWKNDLMSEFARNKRSGRAAAEKLLGRGRGGR